MTKPSQSNRQQGNQRGDARDLDSEEEVHEFAQRFYAAIDSDHPVHSYLVRSGADLQTHEEAVAVYWLSLLGYRPSSDTDSVIEAHRAIHDQMPLDQEVFERWLDTLDEVLDGGWSGPNTEVIRKRSYGMARAMALRFIDHSLHNPPGYQPAAIIEKQDIVDRADLDRFVERFYRYVSMDEVLHPYFALTGHFDWRAHMLTLGDYWNGVLFSRDHDAGDQVIERHSDLNTQLPLTEEAFNRWLELFNVALSRWSGPNAERLQRHAYGMAWAMARRYAGISLPRGSAPST